MDDKRSVDEVASTYYLHAIKEALDNENLKEAKDYLVFLNDLVLLILAQRDFYYKILRKISGGGFNYDDVYYEDIIDLAKKAIKKKF